MPDVDIITTLHTTGSFRRGGGLASTASPSPKKGPRCCITLPDPPPGSQRTHLWQPSCGSTSYVRPPPTPLRDAGFILSFAVVSARGHTKPRTLQPLPHALPQRRQLKSWSTGPPTSIHPLRSHSPSLVHRKYMDRHHPDGGGQRHHPPALITARITAGHHALLGAASSQQAAASS